MATVPFVLHRPIPDDARIKWVYVTRRRVGTHDDWSVQFVVSRESWERADTADARGAVALDLGWRALEDGSLRVAYLLDDHGTSAELTIPAGQVARWGKADELRSIRDDLFRVARARLDDWLAITEVPAWLSDGIAALPRRGSAALAGLVLRWRDHRFPGDEDIHQALETWRKRDKHLLDWEAHQRRRSLRWRDDHYRRFATALRRRYQTVLVEDTDWGRILAMPPAEADTDSLNTRYHARIAAPGRLRELIEEGCERVVRVPARDSTRRCSTCGEHPARDWDPISEIDYRCAAGHRLDQDRNAARNRLREAAGALAG